MPRAADGGGRALPEAGGGRWRSAVRSPVRPTLFPKWPFAHQRISANLAGRVGADATRRRGSGRWAMRWDGGCRPTASPYTARSAGVGRWTGRFPSAGVSLGCLGSGAAGTTGPPCRIAPRARPLTPARTRSRPLAREVTDGCRCAGARPPKGGAGPSCGCSGSRTSGPVIASARRSVRRPGACPVNRNRLVDQGFPLRAPDVPGPGADGGSPVHRYRLSSVPGRADVARGTGYTRRAGDVHRPGVRSRRVRSRGRAV
ncbi:hypothetical protein J2X68_004532 [Streptomyces sp. 3330]|nr:hypothetical protein [Streptomyces sp. 3330]